MAEALPAVANLDNESDECSVCVAVHVRPLIDSELLEGCDALLNTTPQQSQVRLADLSKLAAGSNFLRTYWALLLRRLSLGHTVSHMTMCLVLTAPHRISCMVIVWSLLSQAYLKATMQQVHAGGCTDHHADPYLVHCTWRSTALLHVWQFAMQKQGQQLCIVHAHC